MIRKPVQSKSQGAIQPRAVLWGVVFLSLATLSTSVSCALAQSVAATRLPVASGAHSPVPAAKAVAIVATKPSWQDLNGQQQVALRPLAANWATLPEASKRKWLAVSRNYGSLPVTEQAKMHSRMTEWVNLSQRQRSEARLQYAQTRQLSPAEKAANWQAYQALSPEEKQKLAAKAAPKPAGAATAIKPAPPQKLAVVPVTRKTSPRSAKVAVAQDAVDPKTLRPHAHPASDSSVTENH